MQCPSTSDSIEDLFNSTHHELKQKNKKKKKKRMRSEFVSDDDETSSQEAIQQMAKRIKLLENELRLMSNTQQQMQKDMEVLLIKKNVSRASKPIIKKMEMPTVAMEEAAGDRAKLQGLVNFQHVQYDEIRKMVKATTKYEGFTKNSRRPNQQH